MKFFVLFILSIPVFYFSSCSLEGYSSSFHSENEPECDIFTERCPRSGSGYGLSSSGGSRRRSNSGGGNSNNNNNNGGANNNIPTLSPEVSEAREYACTQYERMFEEIREGVEVGRSNECIMFEDHALLCPRFDYTRGCLRVREIDDPATDARESDAFDMVCINADRLYLDEADSEELRNLLRDRNEITGQSWLQAQRDLNADETTTLLGDSFYRGLGSNALNRCERYDASFTITTAGIKTNAENLSNIHGIHTKRDRLKVLLEKMKGKISQNNLLKRNISEMISKIDKMYKLEKENVNYRRKRDACEYVDDPEDSITTLISVLIEYINQNTAQRTRNDSEFMRIDVSEIMDALNDRISTSDRDDLMERLLERRKREMIRKLIICVYTEQENCLEPREERALQAEIEHIGEFKAFVTRRFVDKYATKIECENRLTTGSDCRGYETKPTGTELEPDAVDGEVNKFEQTFSREFTDFFSKFPYGVACPDDD